MYGKLSSGKIVSRPNLVAAIVGLVAEGRKDAQKYSLAPDNKQ